MRPDPRFLTPPDNAYIVKLEKRLDAAQRAISALVHHVQDRPHGCSKDLAVIQAIDDAIEAYPASHWQKAA